jgi:hypothetical protein
MALGMARGGDDFEAWNPFRNIRPFQNDFRARLGAGVFLVDDPFGPEFLGVLGRIRHVVLVGEENKTYPTHFPEFFDQVGKEFRGIHKPIALRMLDEIAVSTEGFG